MDQPPRQTSGPTPYQSDSVNQVLPSKTHQVDSKRDYGPLVQTNLTLKIIHRAVKLILQRQCVSHTPSVFEGSPASLLIAAAAVAVYSYHLNKATTLLLVIDLHGLELRVVLLSGCSQLLFTPSLHIDPFQPRPSQSLPPVNSLSTASLMQCQFLPASQ